MTLTTSLRSYFFYRTITATFFCQEPHLVASLVRLDVLMLSYTLFRYFRCIGLETRHDGATEGGGDEYFRH